ncbi:FAD-dependent oxidoreductase [Rubellimicrobium sp. CFH 75288]|uniref:GcvT family protein n=1 Tax=Rubellimicrobium sp. CFH 75288 TaxID=2697034 RepID=UPI001412CE79|nr:FAD-dependent oxidoreductase [Rubellimicrobium sp. CFH 75288]NAZ37659.1 FAD-dependent oxidoreductase [Rubellimicrobium sp. CFH 75288]
MLPPSHARAVIVGGGVVGASVAYHLVREGWRDVLLLERRRLTSGTTWHAAGLIAQLRATANLTRLARYSQELYGRLEAETGIATGFRRTGSITAALTGERLEELRRSAAMARAFGVEIEEIAPAEIGARYPHLNLEGVTGGVYLPRDGQGDPSGITMALARGARAGGAAIHEGVRVTGFRLERGRIAAVRWESGDETGETACEAVVNCAGMWAREVGLWAGASVPLQACEHFYAITEPIKGLGQLPVLRVPDECTYYKEDAGKLMVGAFEPRAKPWALDGIPADFEFTELPPDFDHVEPILEAAVRRIPLLERAGFRTFFNGPESFTPDNAYHLGPTPECPNLWVAAGFNSVGIQSAGGAGMALAHWMVHGERPFDLGDVEIARAEPFQRNRRFLAERVSETLGLLYADHFPFRQKATGRGVRRSPFHAHLDAEGAVWGEVAGWERANWFRRPGQPAEESRTWGRGPFFDNVGEELRAFREGVGVYDMSSFGKLRVEGPDAAAVLNRVFAADLDVEPGRLVYAQALNDSGGIEADVTVARLSETAFLVVTGAARRRADETLLRRALREDERAVVTDMTAAEGVLAVMGPRAREVLARVSPADWTALPWGSVAEVEWGWGLARAHRVSYVGELGWEIYVSADMAAHAWEALREAGEGLLKPCGLYAMNAARLEKGFRHMGHDITPEDHILEAGLGFAVGWAKPAFRGRDAVLRRHEEGLGRRLLGFRLREPEPLLYHNEPILRDGRIVGHLTSGAYGHSVGGAVGLGYVPCAGETAEALLASDWAIDVAGRRVPAEASLRAFHDPSGARMRG